MAVKGEGIGKQVAYSGSDNAVLAGKEHISIPTESVTHAPIKATE